MRWIEQRPNSFSEYNSPLLVPMVESGDTATVMPHNTEVVDNYKGYPSDNHNSLSSYASSAGRCGTHSTRLSSRSSMSLRMDRWPSEVGRTFPQQLKSSNMGRKSYSCEDIRH